MYVSRSEQPLTAFCFPLVRAAWLGSRVCQAKTAVALWAIHRSTYRQMLMEATLRKRSLHESFLKNVPILGKACPLEVG